MPLVPLEFFACPVTSPEGVQCPRGSFVHAPYCRFHLQEVLNLDVKTSSVPGAGRGLFSITSRRKGDHLVDYFGEVLDDDALAVRYPGDDTGVYTLGLSKTLFIDAALVRGVGASANAPPPNVRANARFVVNPRSQSARLEVSRAIERGDFCVVRRGLLGKR